MSLPHPYPPAPVGPRPPRPPRSTGLAVASLVTGILALLTAPWAWLVPVAFPLAIAAVVTATIALVSRRPGRGMAVAGVATGGVGFLAAVLSAVLVLGFGFYEGWREGYDDSSSAPLDEQGIEGDVDAFGSSVDLDAWSVTVQDVRTGVDAEIAGADETNAPAHGDYVLVDIDAIYTGEGRGDAYEELYGYLWGGDGTWYDALDCEATVPRDPRDLARLSTGESASFQMCFDVAPGAGADAFVQIDDGDSTGTWGDSDSEPATGSSGTEV